MNEIDDLIDAYLGEKLDPAGMQAFEQLLREDPAVATEFAFRKDLRDALLQQEGEALRARMQRIVKADAPKRRNVWFAWGIAASVCLLLGFTWWWLTPPQRLNHDQLFATYLHPEPIFDLTRSPDDSARTTSRAQLAAAYAQENYPAILTQLTGMPDSLLDLDDLYLKALAFVQTQQDSAALGVLDQILATGNAAYMEKTSRMEVLVLIRLGQLQAARLQMNALLQISSPKHREDIQAIDDWLKTADVRDCRDCK
jgi:hypothetical protein